MHSTAVLGVFGSFLKINWAVCYDGGDYSLFGYAGVTTVTAELGWIHGLMLVGRQLFGVRICESGAPNG